MAHIRDDLAGARADLVGAVTRDPARTALIIEEYEAGKSKATLSVRWGVSLPSLNQVLRGSQQTTTAPEPQSTAPLQYETAWTKTDLTADAYRIVSTSQHRSGLGRWNSTISPTECDWLNDEVKANRIFAPQACVNGEWVRLARVIPIVARKRGRK